MIDFRDNQKAVINQDYQPPEKIAFDRKMVYQRYTDMKNGRSKYEDSWNKWEKQYESWRPPKNSDDWQSNIVPPFTTTIVERILAEIVDQTVRPKTVARGLEDIPKAKVINYIQDYIWEIANGDLELYASLKQQLILGKTIWQEDFWQDRRMVKVLKKFDPDKGVEEYVEKEVDDYNNIYGETVSLWDFWVDPQARSINSGRYKANDCIRRYIMNFDSFREMFDNKVWNPFGALKYVKPGGDLNYWQYYKPPENIQKDGVEVLFYWGRRPDKLVMVANDVVIRDGPNPFNHKQLPFAEGSDVPRLNQFYAKGEPELLESIQDELTTLRRMRIDRQHMDLFKMFLVSNRETLDDDDLIVAPSRQIQVDDPNNSIKALEYRDINASAYREEELLKQDGRNVTGVDSPVSAGTATEAAIFKESTMKALRLKIWLLSRELLTNIVRIRVPNIVQFYSTPMAEKIVGKQRFAQFRQIRTTDVALDVTKDGGILENEKKGENFFEIKPELIVPQYGAYDFKMSAEPTFPLSKPLQQQKINELMQHPIIMGAIQNGYYDSGKLADVMLEMNDFDPENFKVQKEGTEVESPVDEQQLLELANRENELMLSGKPIEPTAYATPAHTQIHVAFMGSPTFKEKVGQDQNILQAFTYHALGEAKAQEMRGGNELGQPGMSGQAGPQTPGSVSAGVIASPAKSAMPGRMIGNEMGT